MSLDIVHNTVLTSYHQGLCVELQPEISENNLYLNETKFRFTCRSTSLKTDCKIDYQLYEKSDKYTLPLYNCRNGSKFKI